MPRARYVGNRTKLSGKDVTAMVEGARPMTYKHFIRVVDIAQLQRLFPQYGWLAGQKPRMSEDYAVRFYRSKFKGKKCYFVDHSANEYVFTN